MKDKEKQIEELVKDLTFNCIPHYEEGECREKTCQECLAKHLIKQGYQKVDKDQVVVLKSEYERLIYVEGELQEMNADYYNELKDLKDSLKDSVVLSREEYEKLTRRRFIITPKKPPSVVELILRERNNPFIVAQDDIEITPIPSEKETAEKIIAFIETLKVKEDGRHQWREDHNNCIDKVTLKLNQKFINGVEIKE